MDDDELMMLIREVLAADEEPGPGVLAAAEAAFRWLCVDDMLADVIFDSADCPALRGVRGRQPPRQLTYQCDDLLIDCEIQAGTLLGHVVPATPIALELRSSDGQRPVAVDDEGCFLVEPRPAGPVSMRCLRAGRPTLVTPWLLA